MRRATPYLWLLLLILAGFGWTRLRLDAQIEHTLGRGVPAVDALITIEQQYTIGDQARVMLSTDEPDQTLSDDDINALRGLLRDSAELNALGVSPAAEPDRLALDWVMRQAPRGRGYLDDDGIASLRERIEPEAMKRRLERHRLRLATPQPSEVTRQMLRDPLDLRELIPAGVSRRLGSAGGGEGFEIQAAGKPLDPAEGRMNLADNAWLLRLDVPFPASDLAQSDRLHEAMLSIVEGYEAEHPGLMVDAAGAHLLAAESAKRVKADVKGTLLFASAGLLAVFVLVWRRVVPVVVLLVTTGVALFTAFGLYGLTGWPLSPLAALSGGMLAGLGVDYGIHLLNEIKRDDDKAGGIERAFAAARRLSIPILTACATTICGFLALATTKPAALIQLALLGCLGLVCVGLAALTLLPMLAGLSGAWTPGARPDPPRLLVRAVERRLLLRTAGVVSAALLVLGVYLSHAASPPGALHDLHPQPNPAIEAQRAIDQRFVARAGSVLLLMQADRTERLHADLELLDGLGLPFDITSAAMLLPSAGRDAKNRALLAGVDPAEVRADLLDAAAQAGFKRAAFDQAGGFLEGFLLNPSPTLAELAQSPEGGLFFPRTFDADDPQTIAILTPTRTWDTHDKRRADLQALRDALRTLPGARATGLDLISEQMQQQIAHDLLRAFTWSAGPVLLILLIGLRSLKRVLVAALPPAMGLLAATAVQQLGSGHWNAINLAAVPLLLGIGVDASVLLSDAAARGSLSHVHQRLRGIYLTFITTFIGFGTLSWTSIPAVRELGWMVIAGLAATLLGTWLFGLSMVRRAGTPAA